MASRYSSSRGQRRQHATLELVVTVTMTVLVVAAVIVFLFVYHDFPLRVSGP